MSFSGIEDSRAVQDVRLEEGVEAARSNTQAKALIVIKLEKVRGLVGIIKAIGEAVGDVSVYCSQPVVSR